MEERTTRAIIFTLIVGWLALVKEALALSEAKASQQGAAQEPALSEK